MFSPTQLLELSVVLCTAQYHIFRIFKARNTFIRAQDKSGPVRLDTLPTGLLGTPFFTLQVILCFLPPTIYVFAVVTSGFQQPSWMNALALPDVAFDVRLDGLPKNGIRVLACLAMVFTRAISDNVLDYLSDQYHPIGRREKSRIVQTGPYAWVRHPLYSIGILQAALQAITFWSYAALSAAAMVAVVYSVKISIEEEIIQRDEGIRDEYRVYMRKVPARLIPYVW